MYHYENNTLVVAVTKKEKWLKKLNAKLKKKTCFKISFNFVILIELLGIEVSFHQTGTQRSTRQT